MRDRYHATAMRIVCVSDTHNWADGIRVPDGDVLVHGGDLTMSGSAAELRQAQRWLESLPHREKIVIAGNHDWGFEREPEESRRILADCCTYLEDSEVTVDGLRFYGSPWQPQFYDWAFNLERGEAIRAKWDLIPAGVDVLITHGPPAGILDRTADGDEAGCEELLAACDRVRPRLHVFGHIHEGYGELTRDGVRHLNASICDGRYQPVNPPLVVEL